MNRSNRQPTPAPTELEHAGATRVPIIWSLNLPADSIGVYSKEDGLFVVRADMKDAQIRLAIATCLATYDVATHGPDPLHGSDVNALALARLLPDERFIEAYETLGGGITCLARFFGVTPHMIRTKLDILHTQGRAARGRTDLGMPE